MKEVAKRSHSFRVYDSEKKKLEELRKEGVKMSVKFRKLINTTYAKTFK